MSFRRVDIHAPDGRLCEIIGFLYWCDDPQDLGQDMVEVRLPNGTRVNAGWYPEGSPEGCYRVSIGTGGEVSEIEYRDVDEVARQIESIIASLSNSSNQVANPSRVMSEKATALLRQGLAQARAGNFSQSPPDLDADADL